MTIVIPFGEPSQGASRLPQLAATLDWARRSRPALKLLVAEAAPRPVAGDLCREHGVAHVFVQTPPGPFHKTRALNHGVRVADTSHVLFLDADLLLPPDFVADALLEAERRGLDGLTPWRTILFLSEADSLAVMRGERQPQACQPIARFTSTGTNRAGAVLVSSRLIAQFGGMIEPSRDGAARTTASLQSWNVLAEPV
ncbi:glycosyltransferase [Bradyrhizobium sp. HKCCYLS3013]|uniref:glycosyltransferase n=1 Tax=Bradyrhizobium sp. HKCCYLS3013 TaxID=3420735 RepID=UPI003EBBB6D4